MDEKSKNRSKEMQLTRGFGSGEARWRIKTQTPNPTELEQSFDDYDESIKRHFHPLFSLIVMHPASTQREHELIPTQVDAIMDYQFILVGHMVPIFK